MRGIYRAIDLYKSDPDTFLESAAPTYDVTPEIMKGDLAGVYYTSYEDALEFFGVGGRDSKLKQVVDGLTEINIELDLMDEPIAYEVMVDPSLTDGLFDGHQR
jgi:NitT/TauT family transport system substrate-binding protein